MDTVTVPRSFYITVAEMAAQYDALLTARRVAAGKPFDRPGDPFGTVLCETWLIDPDLVGVIGAAYASKLRTECTERGLTPPTIAAILKAIPHAINDSWFPNIDVDELLAALAADVPGMAG